MSLVFCNVFVDPTEHPLGFFITGSVIFYNQRVCSEVTVCYGCLFKSGSVLAYMLFEVVNITFEARVVAKVVVDIRVKADMFVQRLKTCTDVLLYLRSWNQVGQVL
jgi:hypothetical protein